MKYLFSVFAVGLIFISSDVVSALDNSSRLFDGIESINHLPEAGGKGPISCEYIEEMKLGFVSALNNIIVSTHYIRHRQNSLNVIHYPADYTYSSPYIDSGHYWLNFATTNPKYFEGASEMRMINRDSNQEIWSRDLTQAPAASARFTIAAYEYDYGGSRLEFVHYNHGNLELQILDEGGQPKFCHRLRFNSR